MVEDLLRYDLIIETALRNVIGQILAKVAKDGLPGEHHFYITFRTDSQGVEIPDTLRKQYPHEMTIVLQHQFSGLKVVGDSFGVVLSFNGVREKLSIPFSAVMAFADPSVNFALQFQSGEEDPEDGGDDDGGGGGDGEDDGGGTGSKPEKSGEVISLDRFRKK